MQFFFEISSISITLALFVLQSSIVGFAISRRLSLWQNGDAQNDNAYLKWFFSISLGLLVDIGALFALGMAACLNRSAVLGTGLLLALLALPAFLAASRENRTLAPRHLRAGIASSIELLVLPAMFFVIVVSALKPPGVWDDTMYHLPLARYYLQNHAIVLNEYVRFPLFPQNIHLLLTLGLMLGNVVTAQAFATLPLFIMGIGLIGAGKWLMGSIFPGALATLVMIGMPIFDETLGYAYIDNGLAMFCWGAALAIAKLSDRAPGQTSYAWVIIAAALAGGAIGSKYFGGVLAMLLGLLLILQRHRWKVLAIYALTAFLAGSWWYVRSAVISGDPIHPAGGNIFGFYLWNAADLALQKQEQASNVISHNLFNLWDVLSKTGVKVWILAFASLLFYRKAPAQVRALQFVFLTYFLFWFFFAQLHRYLAPIYGVGSLLSIYFLYRLFFFIPLDRLLSTCPSHWKIVLPGVVSLLILSLSAVPRYQVAKVEMANWNSTLEKRAGFVLFGEANKLIPGNGPRLVQFGFENAAFFFNGVVIGDWFGPGRYSNFITYDDGKNLRLIEPKTMKRFLERVNSRMLAVKVEHLTFDAERYKLYFDVAAQTSDGLLFVAK